MKEDKPNGKDWWDQETPRTITKVYPHGDKNGLGRGTWMLVCNNCWGKAVEKYGPKTKSLKGRRFILTVKGPVCFMCLSRHFTQYIWWSKKGAIREVGETPDEDTHPLSKPPKEGMDFLQTVWFYVVVAVVGLIILIIVIGIFQSIFGSDMGMTREQYDSMNPAMDCYPARC